MKESQRKAVWAKHKKQMALVEKENNRNDNRVFVYENGKKVEVSPPYGRQYERVKRSPRWKRIMDKHLANRRK